MLGHNVWRGGAMRVAVTIAGWALLLKGAALVVIPPRLWLGFLGDSGFATHYALYGVPTLVLGVYLTVAGFRAQPAGSVRKA